MSGEKNLFITYVLWFFFGGFGLHRLYCEEITGFIIYLVLLFVTGGLGNICFWLVDFFLIPSLVDNANATPQTFIITQPPTVVFSQHNPQMGGTHPGYGGYQQQSQQQSQPVLYQSGYQQI